MATFSLSTGSIPMYTGYNPRSPLSFDPVKSAYDQRLRFFPRRITLTVGLLQVVIGVLCLVFGVLSLLFGSSLAYLGSGLWTGILVLATGVVALSASKRPTGQKVLALLSTSVLALATSGLMVIFCASGLVKDRELPPSVYVDEAGNPVEFLGTSDLRRLAITFNSIQLALGVISCVLGLTSLAVCVRSACACAQGPQYDLRPGTTWVDPRAKADRLLRWLHATPAAHYFPPPWPGFKVGLLECPPFMPGSVSSIATTGSRLEPFPPRHPPKGRGVRSREELRKRQKKRKKRRMKEKELERERRMSRRVRNGKPEVTSAEAGSDVSNTYTGMDREMAEEFIAVAMEPGRSSCSASSSHRY